MIQAAIGCLVASAYLLTSDLNWKLAVDTAAWQKISQLERFTTTSPAKPVWLGEVGAPDKAAAIEKIQGAGHEADSAIREWRHHVALPGEKVRDRVNSEVIFCAAGLLSATPLTY